MYIYAIYVYIYIYAIHTIHTYISYILYILNEQLYTYCLFSLEHSKKHNFKRINRTVKSENLPFKMSNQQ